MNRNVPVKTSLPALCDDLGITLEEGRNVHSGLADAHAIGTLAAKLLDWSSSFGDDSQGAFPDDFVVPLTTPVNLATSLNHFMATQSAMLKLVGLPTAATYS
jgi:hypothetical protein